MRTRSVVEWVGVVLGLVGDEKVGEKKSTPVFKTGELLKKKQSEANVIKFSRSGGCSRVINCDRK